MNKATISTTYGRSNSVAQPELFCTFVAFRPVQDHHRQSVAVKIRVPMRATPRVGRSAAGLEGQFSGAFIDCKGVRSRMVQELQGCQTTITLFQGARVFGNGNRRKQHSEKGNKMKTIKIKQKGEYSKGDLVGEVMTSIFLFGLGVTVLLCAILGDPKPQAKEQVLSPRAAAVIVSVILMPMGIILGCQAVRAFRQRDEQREFVLPVESVEVLNEEQAAQEQKEAKRWFTTY